MSSHFSYEIEESKMRMQLKALDLPFKEDAWSNYEVFAREFQRKHKKQLLPSFNFALSRTFVLPFVFGSIIISFSFLLFNFININNITPVKSQVSGNGLNTALITQKNKPATIANKQVIVPTKTVNTSPKLETTSIATNQEIAKEIPLPSVKAVVADTASVITATDNVSTSKQKIGVNVKEKVTHKTKKKKRRKKGKAEVLESISTPVTLPSFAHEEAEPGLK